jgi:DNA polymerase-3 subunit alpha
VNCAQLKSGFEPFKGKDVYTGGIVSVIENRTSKTGNPFGKIVLEDYQGSFDIMLFGKDFVEYNKFMVPGLSLFIRGRVQERFNQPGSLEFKVVKIELLEEMKKNAFNAIKLKIPLDKLTNDLVIKLDAIVNANSGKSSVEFLLDTGTQGQSIRLYSKKSKVAIEDELLSELNKLPDLTYELS